MTYRGEFVDGGPSRLQDDDGGVGFVFTPAVAGFIEVGFLVIKIGRGRERMQWKRSKKNINLTFMQSKV